MFSNRSDRSRRAVAYYLPGETRCAESGNHVMKPFVEVRNGTCGGRYRQPGAVGLLTRVVLRKLLDTATSRLHQPPSPHTASPR